MDTWNELDALEFDPATSGAVGGITEDEPVGLTRAELETIRVYNRQRRENEIEQAEQA